MAMVTSQSKEKGRKGGKGKGKANDAGPQPKRVAAPVEAGAGGAEQMPHEQRHSAIACFIGSLLLSC